MTGCYKKRRTQEGMKCGSWCEKRLFMNESSAIRACIVCPFLVKTLTIETLDVRHCQDILFNKLFHANGILTNWTDIPFSVIELRIQNNIAHVSQASTVHETRTGYNWAIWTDVEWLHGSCTAPAALHPDTLSADYSIIQYYKFIQHQIWCTRLCTYFTRLVSI